MDALYFRVSSERQTTENQFEDLLQVAEKDGSGRDWNQIREALSRCVIEEYRPGTSSIEFANSLSRSPDVFASCFISFSTKQDGANLKRAYLRI